MFQLYHFSRNTGAPGVSFVVKKYLFVSISVNVYTCEIRNKKEVTKLYWTDVNVQLKKGYIFYPLGDSAPIFRI